MALFTATRSCEHLCTALYSLSTHLPTDHVSDHYTPTSTFLLICAFMFCLSSKKSPHNKLITVPIEKKGNHNREWALSPVRSILFIICCTLVLSVPLSMPSFFSYVFWNFCAARMKLGMALSTQLIPPKRKINRKRGCSSNFCGSQGGRHSLFSHK